ncbi:MAG: PAS domain S-box protein [Promethearchaeota archaeon]|jgi:PAS domain S-box-containing protein
MVSIVKNINKINQLVSENIEDLIFICNENIECEYINIKELQYRKHLIDFIHPNDSKRVVKFVENVFKIGDGREDFKIIGDNNLFKWYETKGKRFVDDDDNRKVILVCRDISKLKSLEKEINDSQIRYTQLADKLPEIKYWKLLQSKESFTAVQKAREMLEVIINNIPQLIYWKDKELTYLGCNANFATMNSMINPSSIIGRSDDDLRWLLDKLDYIQECEYKVIRNNEPEYNVIEFLKASDGREVWYEINRVPLHDLGGKVVGILVTYEDITNRKLSEQKLKESELKYRHLFENSPYSIILVNRKGEIIDCNPATEKIFNNKIEELINRNFLDFIMESDKNLALYGQRYRSLLEGVIPEPIEIQIPRSSDGRLIWAGITESLVDIGGETVFQVIIQDITEKKVAEQELKKSQDELRVLNKELEHKVREKTKDLIESERQYRTTINSLGDPLHVVDKDLRIILVNEALKNWLGLLKIDAEVLGRKIPEVFSFLPSTVYEEYEEVFDTGSPLITMEYTAIPEHNVIAEVRKIPIFCEGRVEQVITIIRDITESREMEIQLEESEEKFRNMVNNLDVAFYKGIFKSKLLMHNQAFNIVLGLEPDESAVGADSTQFFVDEKKQEKYYEELTEKGFVRNFIAQIKKLNGDIVTIDLNAHVIYNSEGDIVEVEGTFTDITEKFKLQQDLLESEKKLREKNLELMKLDEIKNDFITNAAHELKTPLISISGYTDYILMKHRSYLTAEITEDLKTVQRNVTRLKILMDQLLEVMKIDENKLKLQKERVNVSKIINDCLDELSYLINEKNLEVILNINHKIILNVDSTRIFSVFTNLISNAIKFTPDYGWIEISGKKVEDKYIFSVKDNGIGLAENELSRLFIKFERIQHPNLNENLNIKDSGTGLGLYITKSIINLHNGEIQVISKGVNKGTTFEFTLPI